MYCRTFAIMRKSFKWMLKVFTFCVIGWWVVMAMNKGLVWMQAFDSSNAVTENIDNDRDSLPQPQHGQPSLARERVSRVVPRSDPAKDDYTVMIDKRMEQHHASCRDKWTDTFVANNTSYIFYDNSLKLGYCFIAKIGCTFWLRMLSFLTRGDEMNKLGIKTPFDIDRSSLHVGKLGPVNWQYIQDFNKVAKLSTKRFFFTRNPYERLWSVYLDKYYLIDYWVTHPIMHSQCGLSVTFEMFLGHAVQSADHHLVPISKACQPCSFRPNFIGRMETFTKDSEHLLGQAGYKHLLQGFNHSLYVETELKSLIVYNFNAMKYPIFADGKCLSQKTLCMRLWRVFQRNGLIKWSIHFPAHLDDYSVESAVNVFLRTVRENPITKAESKLQRRQAIVAAYSSIKWHTLKAIQKRYREDFDMFGYDMDPPS